MFEQAQSRKEQEYRFLAAIHGVDIDKSDSKEVGEESIVDEFEKATPANGLFGDPAEYEKMSEKEKTIASQKLMAKFKTWAKDTSLG